MVRARTVSLGPFSLWHLDGFFARNPDQITLYGVPGRRHDKLPDNSLTAVRAWQQTMGQRFDIKAFHDRVLEDGAVPVSFLGAKIRTWAGGKP